MTSPNHTMEIPDSVFWPGLAAVVGWFVRLEARLNARPTRKELDDNRIRADEALRHELEQIRAMLEKQNEASQLHRQLVGDALANIREKVAVLRSRAGDDPLDETGAHRRRL